MAGWADTNTAKGWKEPGAGCDTCRVAGRFWCCADHPDGLVTETVAERKFEKYSTVPSNFVPWLLSMAENSLMRSIMNFLVEPDTAFGVSVDVRERSFQRFTMTLLTTFRTNKLSILSFDFNLRFFPHDAMRKRGLCRRKMSCCPSVCPSHAGIVSKQLNLS